MSNRKLQSEAEKNCVLPTISRTHAKELYTVILNTMQIMNLETIKKC